MKLFLSLLLIGCISLCYAQDSTRVIKNGGQKRMTTTPGGSFPLVTFKRLDPEAVKPNITGKFIIEEYSLCLLYTSDAADD